MDLDYPAHGKSSRHARQVEAGLPGKSGIKTNTNYLRQSSHSSPPKSEADRQETCTPLPSTRKGRQEHQDNKILQEESREER
jgi:hypothetical protein